MPIARFEMPDGRIGRFEVPDGTTPEQAQAMIAQSLGDQKPQPSSYEKTAQESSAMDNLLAGAGGSMHGLYLGAKQLLGQATPEEVANHKAAMKGLGSTTSGTIGQFVGAAAPAAATALIPGVNTLTGASLMGAGLGALEPVGPDESRLTNMAIGGAAGAAGQKVAQALGRINRPVQSTLTPEKQILAARAAQEGIPLNVAQATGSKPLKIIDSVLDNMPLTADKQSAVKDAARQKFNAAVGRTFGADEPRLSQGVMQTAKRNLGQKFTDLAQRNKLKLDNEAMQSLATISDDLTKFDTPDIARIGNNFIDDLLQKSQNGVIEGEAYRKFDSALGRRMRSTTNGDMRHALGRIQETVREAMDRSITQKDQMAWRGTRKQYANMKAVEGVVAKDVEGNVSPKLLWNAVNQRNGGDLRDIAEVGKAFVNDIPDSGTAQRAFYQRMIENPLTAVWQQGIGGLGMPLQAALNSQAGQRYFSKGLLDVSPEMARLGTAGMMGVPFGLLEFSKQ